ncbi:eCIS core domain-containing protein [Mesorhizobium sp. BHbsci]
MNRLAHTLLAGFFFSSALVPAHSGGLLGDAIEGICGGCGAGEALDDAHRQVKEKVPPYKAIEEGVSQTVNETLVQTGAPVLQEMIARSRDDALANGVEPIPANIRNNVSGFIPDNILDIARFRVGGGGDLSLQVNSIRYGEAKAITLDYVIIFKNQQDALYNPVLWVHELTHVIQYQNWGIGDFAKRYLRSHGDVEREAYEAETRYMAWSATRTFDATGDETEINKPVSPFSDANSSSMCSSWMGTCQVSGSAPVGTPCWCISPMGPATGSLIPGDGIQETSVELGMPSGYPMQQCGCWGPNPMPFAPEQRCTSQQVRVAVCGFMCAPFHPAYGYVCN